MRQMSLLKSVHPSTLFNDEFLLIQKAHCCIEPLLFMTVLNALFTHELNNFQGSHFVQLLHCKIRAKFQNRGIEAVG